MPTKTVPVVVPTFECPKCHAQIPLQDALTGPLRAQLEAELKSAWEAEARQHQANELEQLRQKLANAESEKEQLAEQQRELKTVELDLRQQRHALLEEKQDFDLELQRAIDAKLEDLSKEAAARADESLRLKLNEYELKIKERDEQNRRLQSDLKAAQEHASPLPSELRGTAQELRLDELLRNRFSDDDFRRVGKGARGADVVQTVRSSFGVTVGTVLWESKRAKTFDKAWIPKLKEDASRERADMAVLVTAVPPSDTAREIAQHDGVWIVSLGLADCLAEVLRSWLLGVAQTHDAVLHRDELSGHVYDYVTGPVFKQHVEGVFRGMQTEWNAIQRERTAQVRRWHERESAINTQARHLASVIGDLQGQGAELVTIKSLELPVGDGHRRSLPAHAVEETV